MRNFVNYALLFSFLILAISGILSFFEPFKLLTTRIHIVFGFTIILLVLIHVADRLRYFKKTARSRKNRGLPSPQLFIALVFAVLLLAAAIRNWWPVRQFINLGYEAQNKAAIFRADAFTAFKPVNDGAILKHAPSDAVQVRLEIEWGATMSEAKSVPQIAIWAENTTGMMIKTFFVSEASAYSEDLQFGNDKTQRVAVLPVWRHRYTLLSGVDPEGKLDGASAATPDHSFSIDDYLRADSSPFYIYVEVNLPDDPNQAYPDGQPSVIYGAYIETEKRKTYHLLPMVARGTHESDPKGHMYYDLEELTSARDIIEKILVKVIREWE
ncbi:MAG: DUF4405 domain-containing protein [Puniceicoccaceae bacterium]